MNYISSKAAVREYLRLSGHKGDLDKSDILAWANDAVSRIITDEQFIHKIIILDVFEFKTQLPTDFSSVVQAAYLFTQENSCELKKEVSKFTDIQLGCKLDIEISCPKCKQKDCKCGSCELYIDVDRLWRSAHPEYQTAYMKHFFDYGGTDNKTSVYSDRFQLMRPSTTSFFNYDYHIKGCINFNVDSNVEYLISHPNILVNFKEGKVLLSYLAKRIDEEGYLMIPDEPVAIEAITWYIQEKMLYRAYMEDFSQAKRMAWEAAMQLRERYIARAMSQLQMPDADMWRAFVKRFIHRVLPNYNYEDDFYRTPENTFKYPEQTYNNSGYDR